MAVFTYRCRYHSSTFLVKRGSINQSAPSSVLYIDAPLWIKLLSWVSDSDNDSNEEQLRNGHIYWHMNCLKTSMLSIQNYKLLGSPMMTSSNGSVFRVTSPWWGTGEFPSQRSMTRIFDVFFDLHLNKRLSKQPRHQWFETPSHSLWRHRSARTTRNWTFFSIIYFLEK